MATDAENIERWYNDSLIQIAAESYFQTIEFRFGVKSDVIDVLIRGNTPLGTPPEQEQYVRMTAIQAEDFWARYEIVDQLMNTSSGFSATVVKEKASGRFILTMRSTEYKNAAVNGDLERDGINGADGEIAFQGFAIGQIRDMLWYLDELKAGRLQYGSATHAAELQGYLNAAPINGDKKLDVVDYSLSGHLAIVLTELHPELVGGTTLFNAAGRGRIRDHGLAIAGQSVAAMLATFEKLLVDPNHLSLADTPTQLGDMTPRCERIIHTPYVARTALAS